MEATTKTQKPTASDRDLAVRLGALVIHAMSYGGANAVISAIDDSGLSFIQMKALVALSRDEEEEHSVSIVADRLGVSMPSASRAVDGLVKTKLATRVEDSEDRRVRRVSLTAKGQQIADEIVAARIQGLERFVDQLSAAERRKLDAALELLLERDEIAELYRSHAKRAAK